MKSTLLSFLLLLCTASTWAQVKIDPARCLHTHQGWGVSLCWWAVQCGQWPEERLDSLVDWLVSPEGLNYTVFRYNIGGGDDPQWTHCSPHHFGAPGGKGLRAEIDGFQDERGGAFHWERDSAQRRIMLMIKRKRPDAIFEAFSNSAPWWMTVSGCNAGAERAGDDNVAPEHYADFAYYLAEVCKHYRDAYGIEFHSLDPFNEPMTDYWYRNGGQEGCHFDTESQIAFIRVLAPELQRAGLHTLISAPDETSVAMAIRDIQAYDRAGVLPLVGQWNTHTYQGNIQDRQRLRHLCDSLNIPLWQSETGDGGRGINGNLRMAQRLIHDIRYLRPDVWCDWQYVEENYDQWSLVRCDHQWGTYQRHANYYVRQHFSRFVPAGYIWLDVDDEHGLAAVSPDGKTLVYVGINTGRAHHTPRSLHLCVPMEYTLSEAYMTSRRGMMQPITSQVGDDGNGSKVDMPAESIVTLLYRIL